MPKLRLLVICTTVAFGLNGPLAAQAINPFDSDGCVPGLAADGSFIDDAGNVLESNGWVAVAAGEVVDAVGNRVVLRENCLEGLRVRDAGLSTGTASAFVVGLGLVLIGQNSNTNGTNGTN